MIAANKWVQRQHIQYLTNKCIPVVSSLRTYGQS